MIPPECLGVVKEAYTGGHSRPGGDNSVVEGLLVVGVARVPEE